MERCINTSLVLSATFQEDVAKSELHELLLNYIRVRSALIGAEKRVSALSQDVEAGKESVWTLRDDKVEETGECADEKEVTAVLQFKVLYCNGVNQISFHPSLFPSLNTL